MRKRNVQISFICYIECQTNFHVCYMILRSIAHIINVMMEKSNMTDSYLFYKGRDIYAWLLNQPGSVETKCIEMISSGVFGSTIVILMVYYVEYKIQLRTFPTAPIMSIHRSRWKPCFPSWKKGFWKSRADLPRKRKKKIHFHLEEKQSREESQNEAVRKRNQCNKPEKHDEEVPDVWCHSIKADREITE